MLAAAQKTSDGFRFAETNDSIRSFIRIGAVEEDECLDFPDEEEKLAKRYADKIELLHYYDASEDVEKTRGMAFLDDCRDKYCVDDVLVCIIRDGLNPEGCWVRINGLGDQCIMGTLLNEPDQDFGYHAGEQIAFHLLETEDKKIICYSNLNPGR